MQTGQESLRDAADSALTEVADGVLGAVPKVITALVFFSLVYVAIKVVLTLLGRSLRRVYPADQRLIARLWVTIAGVFMWFAAALALLNILGLGDIAASLGTATGFLALGVSYALSEMIEDAVAGVYLLRDPDFNPGDRVVAQSFTGTVMAIELRKSRIELESGDTAVIANRDVEPRWTKKTTPETAQTPTDGDD
jgi:small-conductance mechanosensitive channel